LSKIATAGSEMNTITCNAAISACGEGGTWEGEACEESAGALRGRSWGAEPTRSDGMDEQSWEEELALVSKTATNRTEMNTITCNAVISACRKGGEWHGESCEQSAGALRGRSWGAEPTRSDGMDGQSWEEELAPSSARWHRFLDAPDLGSLAAVSAKHKMVTETLLSLLDAGLTDADAVSDAVPDGMEEAEGLIATPAVGDAAPEDDWRCQLCRCSWGDCAEGCGICELPRYMCEEQGTDQHMLSIPCGNCGFIISGPADMPVRLVDRESGRPEWQSLIDLNYDPPRSDEMVLCASCWG